MKIFCDGILCSHIFAYSFTTFIILKINYLVRFQTVQEAVGKPSFNFNNTVTWWQNGWKVRLMSIS